MTESYPTTAKLHPPFSRTNDTFEERTGDPDTFSCAVGRIVIWFADLEHEISMAIHKLLGHDARTTAIITSEMSFKNRVHAMASLIREQVSEKQFNTGHESTEDVLNVIVARCFQAEELRNQVMHSFWDGPFLRDARATRRKITSKAARGLRIAEENVDSDHLLDIADFICDVAMLVEEFMLDP